MGVTRRSVPPSCPVLAEGWRFGEGQARILRREGFGVVTAPDGSLGALLAARFGAALVVVDEAGAPKAVAENAARTPSIILLDAVSRLEPGPCETEGCVCIASKPLDPESLIRAVEQLLP